MGFDTVTEMPSRVDYWQLRTTQLRFEPLPAIMGIVNVTPDSFSDGGKFFTPAHAIDQALRLEDEGADLLDIGGESTRPFSSTVETDEELRRIAPVIEAVASRVQIPISIDTSKSQVAEAAIGLGAEIINDVTGLTGDELMVETALRTGAGVCAMHMQGTPQTMQNAPQYTEVVADIYAYLQERCHALIAAGIEPEKICLDPGIGFGKTHQHNLSLLKSADRFVHLGRPILIGHSRKGFIGKILGDASLPRTLGTVGISLALASKGVQVLRVHDVSATKQALKCFAASL